MSDDTDFDYEDYTDDVDLDPANKPASNRVDRFKAEQGKTYRAALLYFHPLPVTIHKTLERQARTAGKQLEPNAVKELVAKAYAKRAADLGKAVGELQDWEKLDWANAQFKKYQSYYHADVGTVLSRLGKDGAEADKIWNMLGEPRTYYSTIALFYPLDSSGNVDTKNVGRDGYVKLWRFSDGVFRTLIQKNEMLAQYDQSLANSDLKLHCKAAQFQQFDIDPAGAAIWLKVPALKAKFLPMASALYKKLVDAREMSTSELRQKLNVAAGGGDSGADTAEDEMEDLLQSV